MRRAGDLYVAPCRRRFQRIEQPARIGIRAKAVPFTPDDRKRGADETGIIGERAGPGVEDVLGRTGGDLHRRGRTRPALGADVKIVLAPFVEMPLGEDGTLALRQVCDEAVPLVLERNQPPAWQMLRVTATRPLRDRTEKTRRSTSAGQRPAKRPATMVPQEWAISEIRWTP